MIDAIMQFILYNVIDSCGVSNVYSSGLLINAARYINCKWCCPDAVKYECLDKPRKDMSPGAAAINSRVRTAFESGEIQVHHLSIEDLHEPSVMEARKKLGLGELSSLILARKTRQAMLTDDQAARKIAKILFPDVVVQTTPHLFGWLAFGGYINTDDSIAVIEEHARLGRPLRKYLEQTFKLAIEYRASVT